MSPRGPSFGKDQVLGEAFRVLKPGGRFAVSDVVVVRGDVPAEIRRSVELWVGCIAGAMQDTEYTDKLITAGFAAIEIEPTRIYEIEDARQFLAGQGIDVDAIASIVAGKLWARSSARPSQQAAARLAVVRKNHGKHRQHTCKAPYRGLGFFELTYLYGLPSAWSPASERSEEERMGIFRARRHHYNSSTT